MKSFDVVVIGGGVVGSSAAWFLAEGGARVLLLERDRLAAGASGRNQGVIQHPLDPLPGGLYRETVEIYRRLAVEDDEFNLPSSPAGLLLVSLDEAALRSEVAETAARAPELQPELLPAGAAQRLEPALAAGVAACRLETGYPVGPAGATLALARRAAHAGAELREGVAAEPHLVGGRVAGVRLALGEIIGCEQVLLAAGPWTPELVPAWRERPPIRPVWGVVASVALESPAGHVLEELGISDRPAMAPALFSMVSAGGRTGVGSVWLEEEPDPLAVATSLLERGRAFVPALRDAPVVAVRSCARPTSFDRRPFVGALPGSEGLFVCAGHGPWGISTGPATARLVTAQMASKGREPVELPAELAADRPLPTG